MSVRLDRYHRVDDFLAAAGDWLTAREAEHNLILGIASNLRRVPDQYDGPPFLAAVTDASRVLAVALRTPPYNLLLSEMDDPRAVDLIVDALPDDDLPGLVGPPQPARSFAERWAQNTGGSWVVEREEGVYRLTEVVSPASASGSWRLADPQRDAELLEEWLAAFGAEALDEHDRSLVRRTLDAWQSDARIRRYWLWEVGGKPVSLVGSGSQTPNGARIGPVYTPPQHRGKGYASSLTASVSRLLLEEGRRFCFLYTDLANPTANHIYRAIGYERVTDALMIRFAEAS
jgi:uncharacterized protein